ncbi:MAG: hypothetical protein E6R04_03100 [Spirochaetes bacterium]|nr:MAG: hypothetical protein E6R04_03100 [Spirochaetota bacterium]
MPPPGSLLSNEAAGKNLQAALGDEVIQINSDELRSVAVKMQAQAYALEQLKAECQGINDAAERQAAEYTEDREPAPIYRDTVDALKTVGTRIEEEIDKVIKQLEHDSSALSWIADAHDANEKDNVNKINQVDPSGAGGNGGGGTGTPPPSGGGGGLTPPDLTPPKPGTGPQIPPVPPGGFPTDPNSMPPPLGGNDGTGTAPPTSPQGQYT